MNFDYNEEQQLLADSIGRFIAKDYDFEARKKIVASKDGCSAQVWIHVRRDGAARHPASPRSSAASAAGRST